MGFEQSPFGANEEAEQASLSAQWLADLRAVPDFSESDEALIDKLVSKYNGVSMFANQQKLRLARQELTDIDIIEDQLRALRDTFRGI